MSSTAEAMRAIEGVLLAFDGNHILHTIWGGIAGFVAAHL